MKITRLATYLVPPRWLFLRIDTDAGISGWGEPVVEGRAQTVAAAAGELSSYLVGKDPRHIEDHWNEPCQCLPEPAAISSAPVAQGERLYLRYDFAFIQEQSLGIRCNVANDLFGYVPGRGVFAQRRRQRGGMVSRPVPLRPAYRPCRSRCAVPAAAGGTGRVPLRARARA